MSRWIFDRCGVIREITRGKNVLDLGCVDHDLANRGRVRWLHDIIRAEAHTCTGVDREQAAIERLAAEGYDVRVGDAETIDLGRTYDVVVAGELIEHMPNPGRLLDSVKRHLRQNGILVLTTPNAASLYFILTSLLFGEEKDNDYHCVLFTLRTLRKLLAQCGFTVVRAHYIIGVVPQGHNSNFVTALAWIKNMLKIPLYICFPVLCHSILVAAEVKPADQ